MKTYKCGINPESNVHLVYRGGCEKPLTIEDAYRCTGCNQRFHKDCILEHFKQEKDHDWGRADERQKVLAEIEGWLVDEKLTVWKTEPYSKGDKYCCKDGCERCGRVQGIEMGKNELRAELRAKLVEMRGEDAK